ncbi:MAG: type II secretion system protein [Leptolyngbya sp. SIO3F4]|nr:type II secretion system protein [Leptolyngbya sp. SIO3F4]
MFSRYSLRFGPMVRRFPKVDNQGLTLLECLVAISVIGISVAMISPVVLLAVGNRVQSQRTEQALQLAQSEIDKLRLIIERGDRTNIAAINALLPAAPAGVNSVGDFEASVPPPEEIELTAANRYQTDLNFARSVDIDSDGTTDFAVQLFRNSTTTTTSGVALDFGVRVYTPAALDKPASDLGTRVARVQGRGLSSGSSATNPLAVIYTTVIKSDTDTSLCDYYEYIESTTGQTASSPGAC